MNEVFLTSSTGETLELIKIWDSKTATCLMTYRGNGVISPKGVSILGSDFLIAAEKSKPLLKVWPINSQQLLHSPRLLCPGKVSVVTASPDGYYIAVAVEEKLHIYQVSSGCLVGSGVHHFQPITVVRWCCDGSVLACGGEDGMVTVWYLSNLMQQSVGSLEPQYTFNDHSLPVTDLIIASGGSCSRSRLVSVSCDRICKMYDLSCGKLLLSIVFGEMLTAVALTPSQMEVLVGAMTGDINEFSLRNPKNMDTSEVHVNTGLGNISSGLVNVFSGHKKSVTSLSVSLEGDRLLSGSADETVRVWHILSKQCLKVLTLKGAVTNAFFFVMPKKMLEQETKRDLLLCPFQKAIDASSDECNLHVMCNSDLSVSNYDVYRDDLSNKSFTNKKQTINGLSIKQDAHSLADEVKRLRSINEQLFKISVRQQLQKRVLDTNESFEITDKQHTNDDRQGRENEICLTNAIENRKLGNDTIDDIFNKFAEFKKGPKQQHHLQLKKKSLQFKKKKRAKNVLKK